MEHSATVKVPNGKLVNVSLKGCDRIETACVTGDFFLEPPTARVELEQAIEGHPTNVERETLIEAIDAVDAQLIGFDAGHLADATLEAIA